MTATVEKKSISTIEDLKDYVYLSLCADNELLSDAFPMSFAPLTRSNGELRGMLFCVHGPRAVEFGAVWEKEHNRVFFYGPTGERYRETTLEGATIQ